MTASKTISHEVVVSGSRPRVFELFAEQLGEWWPLAYSFSGPAFASAQVEPRIGGRWLERTQSGEELAWGDVRAYERDCRLVLGFGIGADRKPVPADQASEVELSFDPIDDEHTKLTVTHRAFERHGKAAASIRKNMDSEQGWPLILAEFRRAVRLHETLGLSDTDPKAFVS